MPIYHTSYRCEACLCSVLGSLGPSCDPASGQCSCRSGYTGHKCNICPDGGGERHGGCGQGPWGFIHTFFLCKIICEDNPHPLSFTFCLSFPRAIIHCKKGYKFSPSPVGKSPSELSLDGILSH
jgi:hypothetical protein